MQYTQQMRAYKAEFAKLVSEFAHSYPTEVQAARNRLGTMYNPADYPDVSEMYARFDVTTEFIPIPDAKDFRVDVSAEAADEIRQQITESVNMRQVEAVRDCYKRVREVVSKLYDRLSIEDAVFKDSLVSNAQALMDVLPGLNITQDPELDALHTEISATLLVSPNTLRNDPATRENTAKIAKTILDRMPA
jgi:hypothetical protein